MKDKVSENASGTAEIYNFVRTFLVFYYYVLTLSARYSGVRLNVFLKWGY